MSKKRPGARPPILLNVEIFNVLASLHQIHSKHGQRTVWDSSPLDVRFFNDSFTPHCPRVDELTRHLAGTEASTQNLGRGIVVY